MRIFRFNILLLLLQFCSVGAYAYDYAYNNMYFNLNPSNNTATLTYKTSSYNSYNGEIEIPELIVGPKDVMYTVTAIGDNALRNSVAVSKLTIPGTITSIGNGVCYGCTSLTSVIVPSSVERIGNDAFNGCTSLSTVSLNEGLVSIGSNAFRNTVLKNITLPESVTGIGSYCFEQSSSTCTLEKAYLGNNLTTIPEGCFKGQRKLSDVKWSENIEAINTKAFYSCESLVDVPLGNSIKSIGSSAFWGCTALQRLTIPANMETIGSEAFSNTGISTLVYADGCTTTLSTYATKTTKVSLPSSLQRIASNAFYNFSQLGEVIMPDGITCIASSAFEGCSSLMLAKLPVQLTSIESRAFYGCNNLKVIEFPTELETIGSEAFKGCGSLSSLTITTNIQSIGTDAFLNSGITNLVYEEGVTTTLRTYANKVTAVSLPSTLVAIGSYSFYNFSSLVSISISIPVGVTTIGERAFSGCTVMTMNSLPSTITSIGSEAFRDCSAIKELAINKNLESVGSNAFYNSGISKLTYLDGCTNTIPTYANHTSTLVLPASVTEISPSAFLDFRELTGVTLPVNLEKIGNNSFKGCTQLATIIIPASVSTIGTDAFAGSALSYLVYAPGCKSLLRTYSTNLLSVVIPKSAIFMPADAFLGCTKLEDIYVSDLDMWNYLFHDKTSNPIPSEHRLFYKTKLVTVLNADFGMSVMPYAFACQKELRQVNLTGSVTSIREHAFAGCKDLEAVAMGDQVFSVGTSAFEGCSHLRTIRLGKRVQKIEQNAFLECSALNNVHFGGGEKYIGESAFKDCISLENVFLPTNLTTIKASAFKGCSYLQEISIPEDVSFIENRTFESCKRLRSVNIGKNVKSIGSNAFENCDALQTVQMPDSLTNISDYCFNDCDSLRYVYLGSTINSIGNYAFAKCPRLVGFYCNTLTVPSCGSNAFSGSDPGYINLYVPAEALTDYANRSPWNTFGNREGVESAPRWVLEINLPTPVLLLTENEIYNITATVKPADATNTKINWQSNNTAVAYVSNAGTVLANEQGVTTITARAADNGGATATCTVIVDNDYKAVSSIALSQTSLSLREGEETYLGVTPSPSEPTFASVEWSSDNPSVAIVSPYGRVTALKEGTATITCCAADGKGATASCSVMVGKAVSPEIGDVDNDGVVNSTDVNLITRIVLEQVDATGDSSLYDLNGDGEITVTDIVGIVSILLGGEEAGDEIRVFDLNPKEITIDSLETYQLECIVLPRVQAKSLVWTSNNNEVATVDSLGVVTGIKPGEAIVYVVAAGGVTDSCRVMVRPEYYIKMYEDWTSTNKGQNSSTSSNTYTVEANKDWMLSFDWTVSSESNYDFLIVTINNKEVLKESGEKSGSYNYTFPSDGTYTVVVKYTKDSSEHKGNDQATISNFKVEGYWKPIVNPIHDSDELIITANGITFKMIKVEAGTFMMGATSEQQSPNSDEKPVHEVTISKDYYIGETEVTQALWSAVMGYKPTSSGSQWNNQEGLGDYYPAYNISWNDVQNFIERLNLLTGMEFRIPTEAEWEYAARGGNRSSGYQYSGDNTIDNVAWYQDNAGNMVHPVGTKTANELGLYDMSGNVWEWCQDWYSQTYYSSSPHTDPTGPSSGSYRVRRGGGWNSEPKYRRLASRHGDVPSTIINDLGVRLALCFSQTETADTDNDSIVSYPQAVDLGLSVKWASFNVGASSPEEYGDYFAWGETEPKSTYSRITYKWCNGSSTSMTKYCTSSSFGTVDGKTILDLADDAAHVNWGGNWRMPTKAEQDELRNTNNCTWTWTTQNGVNGYKVTSKKNGNSIFLPAAGSSLGYAGSSGYYWSSSLDPYGPASAYDFRFGSRDVDWLNRSRYGGRTVRAVCQ